MFALSTTESPDVRLPPPAQGHLAQSLLPHSLPRPTAHLSVTVHRVPTSSHHTLTVSLLPTLPMGTELHGLFTVARLERGQARPCPQQSGAPGGSDRWARSPRTGCSTRSHRAEGTAQWPTEVPGRGTGPNKGGRQGHRPPEERQLAEKGGFAWAPAHLRSLDGILQIPRSPLGSWDEGLWPQEAHPCCRAVDGTAVERLG